MDPGIVAEWRLWTGLALGAFVGWFSEWLTRLVLRVIVVQTYLGSLARWLTLVFYVAKQGVMWVSVYLILTALHLSLLGFAVGILGYHLYRLALMLFWPGRYLGQRT